MAVLTVPLRYDAAQVGRLLNTPEMIGLAHELEDTRWTGRPGYPCRAMVGMFLIKSLYALPTWTRTAKLVGEHEALQAVLGCAPSVYACYRFATKLREFPEALATCIESVIAGLRDAKPEMGEQVAIDGSDLPAYANGQRFVFNHGPERKVFADPDASWGHRSSISTRKGGGYYGYKVHAAVDVAAELPIAWRVETAKQAESPLVPDLLDTIKGRGFKMTNAILDKGYDNGPIYEACESRGIRPIVPLRETPAVKAGKAAPPKCEHSSWTFAGSDAKRGTSKWRCPTGECSPASVWVKADRLHTLVPRSTPRWKEIYRQRGCVKSGFGRLRHEWGMLPLRVRRIDRVRLHIDFTILAQLTTALDAARRVQEAPSEMAA